MQYMKNIVVGMAVGLAAAGAAQAQDSGFYGTVRAGAAINRLNDMQGYETSAGSVDLGDSSHVTRWLGAVGVGYHLYPGWRAEVEYVLPSRMRFERKATLSEGDVGVGVHLMRSQRLMLNLYRDVELTDRFSLYGNLGLGMAFVKADGHVTTQPDDHRADLASRRQTRFAWNIGAGASYALNDAISLDLGYRYVQAGNVRTGDLAGGPVDGENGHLRGKLRVHEVYLGARYRF
ncbi:adhesin/virulence factor [Bordetella hinzii]|nr:Outer membrane protein PagN precursor [Bordetella hinzii]KCB27924.1 outer membrane protein beta-barrel domain protein [Bordetella hinzii L60]SNV79628.1 adhesin/virulence factor [Bordetella hinzii]